MASSIKVGTLGTGGAGVETGPNGLLVPVWCVLTGWAAGGDDGLCAAGIDVSGVDAGRTGTDIEDAMDWPNDIPPKDEPDVNDDALLGAEVIPFEMARFGWDIALPIPPFPIPPTPNIAIPVVWGINMLCLNGFAPVG